MPNSPAADRIRPIDSRKVLAVRTFASPKFGVLVAAAVAAVTLGVSSANAATS
jgi:hypothetical protein